MLKEINAHGVSVARVRRGADGAWAIVADPMNRRITGLTEMTLSGPVAGSAHLVTKYSPDGTRTRGTLNNCAYGVTPWNTYMTAEENWSGYFVNADAEMPREQDALRRLGRTARAATAGTRRRAARTNTSASTPRPTGASAAEDYRNEPNGFGWMVEIDPFDPASFRSSAPTSAASPMKAWSLPRPSPASRSSATRATTPASSTSTSSSAASPTTRRRASDGDILDEGTLYVAKFNADGTGEWLALAPGQNGLTPENGFADLADILVNTRVAADQAGATKMDRPEWGAVDPEDRRGLLHPDQQHPPRPDPGRRGQPARATTTSARSSAGPRRAATTPRPTSPGTSS